MASGINVIFDEYETVQVGLDFTGPGSITVKDGARITASGDNGFELFGGPLKVKIDGFVGSDHNGVVFYSNGITTPLANATVTVGVEGSIVGNGIYYGLSSAQAVDVVNSGLIRGGDTGILLSPFAPSTSKAISITNNASGVIMGATYGILDTDESHLLTLKNMGTIGGDVEFVGNANITNSGDMGAVFQQPAVALHAVTVTNSGSINGAVILRDANDVVKNTGTILSGIDLGDGDNTLTSSGAIFDGVSGGTGNDILTISGSITSAVGLGEGANKFTVNGNTSSIGGAISFGNGDNTMSNAGTLYDSVIFGNGKNSFTNSGQIFNDVTFGSGNNTVTNKGLIDTNIVFTGNGANKVTNGGTIESDLTFKDGNDTLVSTGNIFGSLSMGKGDDVVTNSGFIYSLEGGDGNDIVKFTGNGQSDTFFAGIYLGTGNDQFTGANARDLVFDGTGNDKVKMGGGDDVAVWSGIGSDSFDGGTGIDRFSAGGLGTGIEVNLDSKAVMISGNTLAATSVTTTGGAATITGFEQVVGTGAGDILAGTKGNEILTGGDGADILYGGGGVDILDGGAAADTYIYRAVTDSGKTRATRDIVQTFTPGSDKFDLGAIDANTKTAAADDPFVYIGLDNAFTKIAGQLRTVSEPGHTILQGDVNGDGKGDFTIDIVGTVTLSTADFVL